METMKRKWGKPVTKLQVFAPNEFVAVCVPVSTAGLWGPWEETNNVPGLQTGSKTVAVSDTSSPFHPYIGNPGTDDEGATSHYNADHTQYTFVRDWRYTNLDGFQYVQLIRIPNNRDYVQYQDWYTGGLGVGSSIGTMTIFYTTDGKTYYQQKRPDTSVYTNHS